MLQDRRAERPARRPEANAALEARHSFNCLRVNRRAERRPRPAGGRSLLPAPGIPHDAIDVVVARSPVEHGAQPATVGDDLVCRLLLEKKKNKKARYQPK